jgi:hypothetical protein
MSTLPPVKNIKQYTRVKFTKESEKEFQHTKLYKNNSFFLYLGEIPNMPGHCAVAGWDDGKIYSGYHTDTFEEDEPYINFEGC